MRIKVLLSALSIALPCITIAPHKAHALNMLDRTCRLEATDTLEDGRYGDVHLFAAIRGNTITMSIEADTFDPVMLIRAPDTHIEGRSNDSLQTDLADNVSYSSRRDIASTTSLKSGIYAIIVTSEDLGALGNYRLRVNSIDQISQPFQIPSDCTGY